MESLIYLKDVKYKYKDNQNNTALKDINVKIAKGEFISIIGSNGSGKSTFARLLNAIILPSEGIVRIKGMNSWDDSFLWDIRKCVGMVFQNPDNQIIAMTVEEDVAFGPENLGLSHNEIIQRVHESLREVGMDEYMKVSPQNLSQGQKQRVALAGILAMRPECIVLDEATSMLDPQGRDNVMKIIKRLNTEHKITIIYITQYMEEAIMADRVLVFNDGRIQMDDNPQKVFSNVSEIKKLGLSTSQVAELFYELSKEGYNLPKDLLTIEDAIKAFKEVLNS
ncbi:UNVERIFIED_CONTAM: energy-coupling factor transport system ATP-binding protein [Acetivibrio alkalicellulosi]